MRTTIIAAFTAAALATPASAHDSGNWQHKNSYLRTKVTKLGASPGCNLVKDECKDTKRTGKNVREYFDTMRRMIAPPPPPPTPVTTTGTESTQTYSAPAPTTGGPEAYAQCESGGDWNAVNPSSGAYGRYQIMPQHYNGGMCSDLGRDPGGQTTCANRIYETQGSGAWSQCGG